MLPFEDTEKEKLYLRREHITSETAPMRKEPDGTSPAAFSLIYAAVGMTLRLIIEIVH